MTTETVLTDEQREKLYLGNFDSTFVDGEEADAIIKAIEQAVLRSPEVQALRKDAERYRWLRKRMISVDFEYGDPPCIALAFVMPRRDIAFSANCDANVDLGMEKQP